MPTSSPEPAISATGLSKSYGGRPVLVAVDLTVPLGSIFALLGPNGSGKTTAVQILSTLRAADSGTARILGHDLSREPEAVRAAIGVTGQFSAVDNVLTGEENLALMARLYHLPRDLGRRRARALLERFDLLDVAGRPPATYSGGMRRRLDLAMTLMGDPRLIFLDEPTTGLDPRSRRTMWQIVRELVLGGVTVFLTTQYLDEADELADRIAVLDGGRVVAEGSPAELKRRVGGAHVVLQFAGPADLDRAATSIRGGTRDDEALTLRVPAEHGARSLRAVLDRLDDTIALEDVSVQAPDLDDVFFALTGQGGANEVVR